MELVLDSLKELVDYELAVVLGVDSHDRLRVQSAKGPLVSERLLNFSISLETRPDLREILKQGKPVLVNTDSDIPDTYAGLIDLPESHSCLVAPLVTEHSIIGMLTLDHRECGKFTEGIIRFIAVISRLLALALAQARLGSELREKNEALLSERNSLLNPDASFFKGIAGSSPAWLSVLEAVKLVAATPSPVLILGETGTGKEEIAKLIHRLSDRSNGPFVALNCSALPASLAESELFGHEKGSFTGAHGSRKGRFELADGGTLFLDELGDIPMEIQPKLLRALQEASISRVGAEKTIAVDIRVIAATHVNLLEAVRRGSFREDLYYRVAVFPLQLPALRERGEDIIQIAGHFLERLKRQQGWEGLALSPQGAQYLMQLDWPGNVRELKNTMERAAILSRGGIIGPQELGYGAQHVWYGECADSGSISRTSSPGSLKDIEKKAIEEALEKSAGRIYGEGGTAAMLGLKPSTLQSRMKKLGLGTAREWKKKRRQGTGAAGLERPA